MIRVGLGPVIFLLQLHRCIEMYLTKRGFLFKLTVTYVTFIPELLVGSDREFL